MGSSGGDNVLSCGTSTGGGTGVFIPLTSRSNSNRRSGEPFTTGRVGLARSSASPQLNRASTGLNAAGTLPETTQQGPQGNRPSATPVRKMRHGASKPASGEVFPRVGPHGLQAQAAKSPNPPSLGTPSGSPVSTAVGAPNQEPFSTAPSMDNLMVQLHCLLREMGPEAAAAVAATAASAAAAARRASSSTPHSPAPGSPSFVAPMVGQLDPDWFKEGGPAYSQRFEEGNPAYSQPCGPQGALLSPMQQVPSPVLTQQEHLHFKPATPQLVVPSYSPFAGTPSILGAPVSMPPTALTAGVDPWPAAGPPLTFCGSERPLQAAQSAPALGPSWVPDLGSPDISQFPDMLRSLSTAPGAYCLGDLVLPGAAAACALPSSLLGGESVGSLVGTGAAEGVEYLLWDGMHGSPCLGPGGLELSFSCNLGQ